MSDTTLNGYIKISQEKYAYFADVVNRYFIRFCKLHLSTQRNYFLKKLLRRDGSQQINYQILLFFRRGL